MVCCVLRLRWNVSTSLILRARHSNEIRLIRTKLIAFSFCFCLIQRGIRQMMGRLFGFWSGRSRSICWRGSSRSHRGQPTLMTSSILITAKPKSIIIVNTCGTETHNYRTYGFGSWINIEISQRSLFKHTIYNI